MAKNFTSKNDKVFSCEKCNFVCVKKGDYNRHLLTLKHKRLTVLHPLHQTIWTCEICQKTFKHQSSFCKHKKRCEAPVAPSKPEQPESMNELLEQYKTLVTELASKEKVVNNFNINFYLNDTCKDALNISDFLSSLQIQLGDLNYIREAGFSEGLSAIMVNGLKDLDETKRPLQCYDHKNNIVYIKDKDEWTSDGPQRTKLRATIGAVVTKCTQNLHTWEDDNPSCLVVGTKENEEYCELVRNTLGSVEEGKREKEIERIMNNVTAEVQMDKKKVSS